MTEQTTGCQVDEAKEVLSKMDPELAVMAIQHAEVNFKEVKEIKDFLAKHDSKAVKYAIAEVQQEEMSKEFESVKEKLSSFKLEDLKEAAVSLGFLNKVGLCFNGINCKGACVQVMLVPCQASMYTQVNPVEHVINTRPLGNLISNGVAKALKVGNI
jgi:hypothetical protein